MVAVGAGEAGHVARLRCSSSPVPAATRNTESEGSESTFGRTSRLREGWKISPTLSKAAKRDASLIGMERGAVLSARLLPHGRSASAFCAAHTC